MFAIAELTFKRFREPASFMLFALAVLVGFFVADSDALSKETTEMLLLPQFIQSANTIPVLTSTLVAFILSSLVAIFIGAVEIPRDISSGLVMLILVKPVTRLQYLLGRYLGTLVMCILFFTITEFTVVISHYISTDELYSLQTVIRQFYVILALFPMVALATMFSCFMADISAMIVTALYLMFSLFVSVIPILFAMLSNEIRSDMMLLQILVNFIYYPFPNFLYYFQNFYMVGLVPLALLLYSTSLTVIFLGFAVMRLRKRDLI